MYSIVCCLLWIVVVRQLALATNILKSYIHKRYLSPLCLHPPRPKDPWRTSESQCKSISFPRVCLAGLVGRKTRNERKYKDLDSLHRRSSIFRGVTSLGGHLILQLDPFGL